MTKKLHELIEMAESGQKFTAIIEGKESPTYKSIYFLAGDFSLSEAKADWTVRMNREPFEIWLCQYPDGVLSVYRYLNEKEAAKRGKPIKFVEVMDEV